MKKLLALISTVIFIGLLGVSGYGIQHYINACTPLESSLSRIQETLSFYRDAIDFYARMSQALSPINTSSTQNPHKEWQYLQEKATTILSIPPARPELGATRWEVTRQLSTFDKELAEELSEYDRHYPGCQASKEKLPKVIFEYPFTRSALERLIK